MSERVITISEAELYRLKLQAKRVKADAPKLSDRAVRDFVARSEGFSDWGAVVRAVSVPLQEQRA